MSFLRRYTFDGQPIFLLGEKASGFATRASVQEFYTIRKQFVDAKSLFIDPEFPASDRSLYFSKKPDRAIKWLRPRDINANPQFFVEGHSRFDIQQGLLGNCWLLAAAASLSEEKKLFNRVVCADNSFKENYAGIFHFRFWQYGKWVDVCIDDRLPTHQGKLVYMRSTDKNEFWSALLEKAYAKLHGSYEALSGGLISEGLQDFTGGVTEVYNLKDNRSDLFQVIEKAFLYNSLVGCTIHPDPNVHEARTPQGLIKGHAYSITKVAMVDIKTANKSGKVPLVCVRNPWGNDIEWNGAWSDKAPEWQFISMETKKSIGLSFAHDGEFWISYEDFLTYFDDVEICILSADSLTDDLYKKQSSKWGLMTFEGNWVEGVSAGGCRNYPANFYQNPQYVMTLTETDKNDDKCSVVIALLQKHRRSRKDLGLDNLPIGFAIYRVTPKDLALKPLGMNFFKTNRVAGDSPAFMNIREVSFRLKLPPGQYLIVPSTYEPNQEAEFLIRIFSQTSTSLVENDETIRISEPIDPKVARAITESIPNPLEIEILFKKTVEPGNEIGWVKLKRILDKMYREEFMVDNKAKLPMDQARAPQNVNQNNQPNQNPTALSLLLSICCGTSSRPTTNEETRPLLPVASPELQFHGFSKDACRSMVAMLDSDHSGKLGLKEFTILLTEFAKWKAVFKLYTQGGEKINTHELRDVLASVGYRLNKHILNSLVYRYGARDKKIAFDDFIHCAVKVKTIVEHFKSKDYKNSDQATFSLEEWITKSLYC